MTQTAGEFKRRERRKQGVLLGQSMAVIFKRLRAIIPKEKVGEGKGAKDTEEGRDLER